MSTWTEYADRERNKNLPFSSTVMGCVYLEIPFALLWSTVKISSFKFYKNSQQFHLRPERNKIYFPLSTALDVVPVDEDIRPYDTRRVRCIVDLTTKVTRIRTPDSEMPFSWCIKGMKMTRGSKWSAWLAEIAIDTIKAQTIELATVNLKEL